MSKQRPITLIVQDIVQHDPCNDQSYNPATLQKFDRFASATKFLMFEMGLTSDDLDFLLDHAIIRFKDESSDQEYLITWID